VRILGTGSALPKKVVTNDDLAGFLDTNDEWISTRTGIHERRVLSDETLQSLAERAGRAAMEDGEWFRETIGKIVKTREASKERMRELGFRVLDSQSNFLFVTHRSVPARELFQALRQNQIIVRYFDRPRIDNYLRITVGTDEEMDALIRFLTDYLKDR
jgi:histidinol-phosphate aminotransferase